MPLSLVFLLPGLLCLLLLASLLDIFLLENTLGSMNGSRSHYKVILSHPQQQASLSKVILADENFLALHKYKGKISSNFPKELQNLMARSLASKQILMEPLSIIFLRINWFEIASMPDLPIEKKLRPRHRWYIDIIASHMQNRHKRVSFVLVRDMMIGKFINIDLLRKNFKHINVRTYKTVRSPLPNFLLDSFGLK